MDSSPPSLESPGISRRAFPLQTFFSLQTSPFPPAAKNPEPPLPTVSSHPERPSVVNASPPSGSSLGIQMAQPTPTANSRASSPAQINPVFETASLLQTTSSSSSPNSVVPPKEPPYPIDGDSSEQELVGITLAGLAIISLVAFIFAIIRKNRNKHTGFFGQHNGTGPSNFSMKSDGQYRHAPHMGSSDCPYPKPQKIPSISGGNYVSHGGNGFHSGLGGSVATGNSRFHSGLANSVATENSKIHTGVADSAAMGSSRIYSGLAESGLIGNPKFHPGLVDPGAIGNSKPWFTLDELINITGDFSPQNFLGEGGFGPVYKGQLLDGREVAVKELKMGSGQGEREFKAEVEIISRVHHRHLVSLVGYCIAKQHRLLVYEFVPNSTLEHHLHGKGMPVLDWSKRVKVAIGAAKGLAYLHEDCHPRIIHRDIKSANILLDNSFEAQVADFGLAKPSLEAHTHVTTRVMGTVGYLAPEYASSGKLTDRSDVFSFGVVLLELVTGRKPVDPTQPFGEESLVDWARPLLIHAIETGDLRELLDPRLGNNYVESEVFNMIEIAAVCLCHAAPKRPRMVQVVRALDSEGSMSDLSSRVKYSQSPAYGAGQYPPDIQKFRQMGFVSGQHSPAYGTSREYEPKISGYSGQYHPIKSPQRAPRKGRDYGFDYGARGDDHYRESPQREHHLRESAHRPLRTPMGSDYSSDYGTSREHERKNYPQNWENHFRKAPPRPQNSRKGGSEYSSGYGSSREHERKTATLNEEHQSRELPHRTNSLDMEASDSSRQGNDRSSGGIPANSTSSGRFDRR